MKFILIFYFLIFSIICTGQDSSFFEPSFRISNCKTNPFDCLPSLKHSFGDLNYQLNQDLVEYDSIFNDCDEVLKIYSEHQYSNRILNVEFILFTKETKKNKIIKYNYNQLKDTFLLKTISNGDFICFIRKGEIVYFKRSCEYDNSECERGFGIWSSSPPTIRIDETNYLIDNKYLFIREDESVSFLNFINNKLISSFLIEERFPNKLKLLKQFCSINPFYLKEGYCNSTEYSAEFIQKVNMQVEKAKSEKAELEEIYRRVKGSNLFKKF